jgi:hypothetical protein
LESLLRAARIDAEFMRHTGGRVHGHVFEGLRLPNGPENYVRA